MKFLFRKSVLPLLLLAFANCQPAIAGGYGDSATLPFVDAVVNGIGLRDFPGLNRDVFAVCLVFCAFFFGVFTHFVTGDRGLGRFGNGLAGAAGVCLGLRLWGSGLEITRHLSAEGRFNAMLIFCAACAVITLVVVTVSAKMALRLLGQSVDRLHTAEPPKPLEVEASSPHLGSAARK